MKPQTFAMIAGAVVGGTGLMGMISPLRRPMVENIKDMKLNDGYSKIAGVIPTNTLFNFVRLGIGITGILASRKRESSVLFNRVVAGNYALMAVMGVIPKTKTMFGLMPIFGGNVWVHAGTAAAELLTEEELLSKARDLVPFKRGSKARVNSLGYQSFPETSYVDHSFEDNSPRLRPLSTSSTLSSVSSTDSLGI